MLLMRRARAPFAGFGRLFICWCWAEDLERNEATSLWRANSTSLALASQATVNIFCFNYFNKFLPLFLLTIYLITSLFTAGPWCSSAWARMQAVSRRLLVERKTTVNTNFISFFMTIISSLTSQITTPKHFRQALRVLKSRRFVA